MTKKKIVIRVQVQCDKGRSKALKIAAEAPGVASVSWEEDDREKLVVTGEVDAVCLTGVLRKKFRCVTLLSVEDVKPQKKPEKKEEKPKRCSPPPCHPCPPPCPPCPPYYYAVYDQPGCLIL